MTLVGNAPPELRLNVLVKDEGGLHVVRCVELNLVTADVSEEKAWRRICTMIVAQIADALVHGRGLLNLINAPTKEQVFALMQASKEREVLLSVFKSVVVIEKRYAMAA